MVEFEHVPPDESDQIDRIVEMTVQQLENRYKSAKRVLRGVHPKDHGCVSATLTVLESIPEEYRVGLFTNPGQQFDAWIRFSNAATLVAPDSELKDGVTAHGSRGMAVKVLGVTGSALSTTNLTTTHGPLNQDFLMVNHPVFAFANVEDYNVLSRIILEDNERPDRFFKERIRRTSTGAPDMSDPATRRAVTTAKLFERIRSAACPPAFQSAPLSPLDNRYFSAAPFLFGEGRAMKFGARPVSPLAGDLPDISADENYLRTALNERLTKRDGRDIVFDFQVQVRSADDLAATIDTDIEDVCVAWEEDRHPFVTVATIAIPPQDCTSPERREFCETLVFSPWHGLAAHRPLGGINRLRRAVYEASAGARRALGTTVADQPVSCPYGASVPASEPGETVLKDPVQP